MGKRGSKVSKEDYGHGKDCKTVSNCCVVVYDQSHNKAFFFRLYDIGTWKAEEYRNVILFFFHFIIDGFNVAGRTYRPEMKIWAALAYLVRAYVLPDDEFYTNHKESDLVDTADTLLRNIEGNYGKEVMSYNVHQISHFHWFREGGNFAGRSAFPAEGMYSQIRRGFCEGKNLD
jgi:hypothetical protein